MTVVEIFERIKQDIIRYGDDAPTTAETEGIVFLKTAPPDWRDDAVENQWYIILDDPQWKSALFGYYLLSDNPTALPLGFQMNKLTDVDWETLEYMLNDVAVSHEDWRRFFKQYSCCANCDASDMSDFAEDCPFDPLCYGCASDIYDMQAELGDEPENRIEFYEFAKEIMEREGEEDASGVSDSTIW